MEKTTVFLPTTKVLPGGCVVRVVDDMVVAHPALESMPFQKSIEPWVRACFGGASFLERTESRVDPAELDLRQRGVLVIQAPKGAGKSKAIRDAVQTQLSAKVSVVQITFRRSLAWSSSSMMGHNSSLYSAIPDGAISARQHPRLTIVVNSISRIRGAYDVVIIDEIVSVLDMLAGTLLSDCCRVQALTTLAKLIGSARTVVIADAMLDSVCVDFVLLCRQMAHSEVMPRRLWPEATADLHFIDYTQRLHEDYSFIPHVKLGSWSAALEAAVSSGQRVVIPCMTKVQAETLAARYRDLYRVQLYTADTDPGLLQSHMSNIHASWSAASILIYSPVITAGCSFELDHFDVVFFFGCSRLGTVRSAIQMIARVRSIRTRTVHVFISKAEVYEPLPAETLLRSPLFPTVVDYSDGYMKLYGLLEHHRKLETLCSAASFPYYFWSLVVHSGARIVFAPGARPSPVATIVQVAVPQPQEPAISREHWWCHNWEADVTVDYDLDGTVVVTGSLLERAAQIQPDHVRDLGTIPRHFLEDRGGNKLDEPNCLYPNWMAVTGEMQTRTYAWVLLMARRVAAVPHAVVMSQNTWQRWKPTELRQPHVILYPPTCGFSKHVKRPETFTAFRKHVARYMDTTQSWMDVTMDAWEVAGVEAAVKTGSQPQPVAMRSSCIPESLHIGSRVGDMLGKYNVKVLHVGCQLGQQHATSFRFSPAACLVDFMVEDMDGRFSVIMCRASGTAAANAATDLMKLQMLAAASDVPIAEVSMLYLGCNQVVRQLVPSGPPSTLLDSLATASPAYIRPWHVTQHVLFLHVDRTGAVYTVFCPATNHLLTNMDATTATTKIQAECKQRRVVTWGGSRLFKHTNHGCMYVDIEQLLQEKFGVPALVALDIRQANVMRTNDAPAAVRPTGSDDMDSLLQLYLGICRKMFFIYFWNGKPTGVFTPSLFLQH